MPVFQKSKEYCKYWSSPFPGDIRKYPWMIYGYQLEISQLILHVWEVFSLLLSLRGLGVNHCCEDHYEQGNTLSEGKASVNMDILNRLLSATISNSNLPQELEVRLPPFTPILSLTKHLRKLLVYVEGHNMQPEK